MTDKDDREGLLRRMLEDHAEREEWYRREEEYKRKVREEASRIAEEYTFKKARPDDHYGGSPPGPNVKVTFNPLPPVRLPDGLCWHEYDNPPASELANGICVGMERRIYGLSGPRWPDGTYSQFEPGPWPVTMAKGAEYFCIWLYKDAAL